ncbi:MAG: divergent polysaccharide deacetylase family protein [Geminicoccaceae bacterium]
MGAWWQRGRRSRRSPGRLFGQLLAARYGAAEGVLGAVALMLLVWLLWPEARGPQLEQRAILPQGVEKVEQAELQTERAADSVFEAPIGEPPTAETRTAETLTSKSGTPSEASERPVEPERRRIARPSELADRLDSFGRRPGQPVGDWSRRPAPRRPSDGGEPAIAAELLLQEEVPPLGERDTDTAEVVLTEVIGLDDAAEPPLEVAELSTEGLDTEPLPEVDLSDLDALNPLDEAEPAPGEPVDPAALEVAAATPTADAAVEPVAIEPVAIEPATSKPFVVERDAAAPATGIWQRPRDDAPTWLKNAVAAAVDDERPIIAIVIDDLGLNRSNTAAFNGLPSPLTLAFLPYAGRIEAQTEAALAAGHELLLHLPMEPIGSAWPGPDALTTKIDQEEFTARLIKNLSRFEGFVGINNHMGSRLTADRSRMEVVMRELRERDVLFLDSKTSARSVASDIAGLNGVPNTTRDVFIDNVIDVGAIKRQLVLAESVARQSGSAVAIGHPHGATIQALRDWLPSLEARGFALAPISAVVARRACSRGVLIAAETCGRYLQAHTPTEPALVAKDG